MQFLLLIQNMYLKLEILSFKGTKIDRAAILFTTYFCLEIELDRTSAGVRELINFTESHLNIKGRRRRVGNAQRPKNEILNEI